MPDKKPIRILRIIARLNVGGPAIQAISLSSELSPDRYQTMLVCGQVSAGEGDMAYLAKEKGVKPVVIPELGREISIFDDLKCFFALRRIIKRFRPDIIHTHTAKAGTLGRLAALSINAISGSGSRISIVHTFHGHVFHSYFSTLKTFAFIQIERLLARFTDRIITISPLQKRDICDKFRIAGKEKVKVIRLGFDLSGFGDCERKRGGLREKYFLNGAPDKFLVGTIGRLARVKNHSLLLNAVMLLKDRGKLDLFRFLIVGDGELRAELENEARNSGVQEEIIFAGWHKYMPPVYEALDAVALMSKNEGTPVTLIEAMAASKPVVATDVGGVRDLLGEIGEKRPNGVQLAGNGILVPPEDAEALANALLFLLENRKKIDQMTVNAKNFVSRKYSLKRLVDDIEILYAALVNVGAA
jgi:glycosyltransferase involved in cell wall biosynthesis